jgi:hypothetical protein
LALKADASAVTTALALKADASALTAGSLVDQFPNSAALPLPSGSIGIRHALAENILSVSNGVTESKVAMLNEDGDLIANIIPRVDTLANLQMVIGETGEIASPTDISGILKYTGDGQPGGELIQSGSSEKFAENKIQQYGMSPIFGATTSSPRIVGPQLFNNGTCNLYVVTSGGISFFTLDGGLTYRRLPAPPVGGSVYQVVGDRILAASSGALHIFAINGNNTWTAATGLGTEFTGQVPYITELSTGGFIASCVSSNQLHIRHFPLRTSIAGSALQPYPLAVTSGYNRFTNIRAIPGNTGTPAEVFILAVSEDKTRLHLFDIDNNEWTEIGLPQSISSFSQIEVMSDKIVATFLNAQGLYRVGVCKYVISRDAGELIQLQHEGFKLSDAFNPTTGISSLIVSSRKIFIYNVALRRIHTSEDGLVFKKIDLVPHMKPAADVDTIWSPSAHENGLFFATTNSAGTTAFAVFVSNEETVSKSTHNVGNMTGSMIGPDLNTKLIGNTFTMFCRLYTLDGTRPESQRSGSLSASGNITVAGDTTILLRRDGICSTHTTTQAAVTLTLPPCPTDLDEFKIYFKAAVTTLTVACSAADTATVVNGVGANVSGGGASLIVANVAINQLIRFTYFAATNEWIFG